MSNQTEPMKKKAQKEKTLQKNSLASLTKAELLALLEEKLERVEELNTEDEKIDKIRNYHCKDCQVKFKTNIQKRKCPSCKSKNIEEAYYPEEIIETTKEQNYIHVPGSNIRNTYKDAQTGEILEGKRARSEPVNLNKIKKIKAIDNGVRSKEDEKFDKKVIFNKTPRERSEFKLIKKKCSGLCGKTYEINPALLVGRAHWECDDCLFSKR